MNSYLKFWMRSLIQNFSGNQVEPAIPGPDFVSGVKNVTVPEGRDVTLSCTVMRLGTHKVAWIHYDRSAILTVQNNVITRNPRIGVSHDGHSVWNLHIRSKWIHPHNFLTIANFRDVERSDEGQYMCQINTARAKTRLGNLHVVGKTDHRWASSSGARVTWILGGSVFMRSAKLWRDISDIGVIKL